MCRQAGSGTDPGEGAALAGALLTALADRAALTLATTHHASLKELAVGIPSLPHRRACQDRCHLACMGNDMADALLGKISATGINTPGMPNAVDCLLQLSEFELLQVSGMSHLQVVYVSFTLFAKLTQGRRAFQNAVNPKGSRNCCTAAHTADLTMWVTQIVHSKWSLIDGVCYLQYVCSCSSCFDSNHLGLH